MSNISRFMPAEDRKAIEVIQSLLVYAERELGALKAPQSELTAAVTRAIQLSTTVLGNDGCGSEISLHNVSSPYDAMS